MLKDKSIKKYLPEILTLCLYMILMSIIMYFHEPWYDEAQAWLIARDASIKEILFELPHYEGHPPIWHLILLPFAKLGAPYELSLKFVSLTFSSIAMGLFIFKSPFERKIKLLIPFTYFFFYQYGVISRPYCVMMLGFVLAAMFYKEKDKKPFRFVSALAIICSSSAYGIILSCGICVVWIIEIFKEEFTVEALVNFIRSKRIKAILFLLLYNIILIILIIPKDDTYAVTLVVKNNEYLKNFIYALLILPGDVSFLDIYNYFTPRMETISTTLSGIIGSIIVIVLMLGITSEKKKTLLFIVPYNFLCIFITFVYFSPHHIGVGAIFFMFILWCCKDTCITEKKGNVKFLKVISEKELYMRYVKWLCYIIILISISYSGISSLYEIRKNYGEGKNIAEFIKDNNLDQYKIFDQWNYYIDPATDQLVVDTNTVLDIGVLPYFQNNIFYNYNIFLNGKSYITHKLGNDDKNIDYVEKLSSPEIIIGNQTSINIFKDKSYIPIYKIKSGYVWKSNWFDFTEYIYMDEEIFNKYDFDPVEEY